MHLDFNRVTQSNLARMEYRTPLKCIDPTYWTIITADYHNGTLAWCWLGHGLQVYHLPSNSHWLMPSTPLVTPTDGMMKVSWKMLKVSLNSSLAPGLIKPVTVRGYFSCPFFSFDVSGRQPLVVLIWIWIKKHREGPSLNRLLALSPFCPTAGTFPPILWCGQWYEIIAFGFLLLPPAKQSVVWQVERAALDSETWAEAPSETVKGDGNSQQWSKDYSWVRLKCKRRVFVPEMSYTLNTTKGIQSMQ